MIMPSCHVPMCTNNDRKSSASFHRIPKNRVDVWCDILKISADKRRAPNILVCSDHFNRGDILKFGTMPRLRAGCVPNIFEETSSILRKILCTNNENVLAPPPATRSRHSSTETAILSDSSAENDMVKHCPSTSASDSEQLEKEIKRRPDQTKKRKIIRTKKSSSTPSFEKNRNVVQIYHSYSKPAGSWEKEIIMLKKKNQELRKKYRVSQTSNRRLRKKILQLSTHVKDLKSRIELNSFEYKEEIIDEKDEFVKN